MDQHKEELATLEAVDSGAVYTLALKTHVGFSVETFRYYAGWCDKIQVEELYMGGWLEGGWLGEEGGWGDGWRGGQGEKEGGMVGRGGREEWLITVRG